uniref:Kelch like family member 32 n=1 Tax=Coturnix japonica TaxID=93934 RepID=A0A8C2Y4W9_COTJA
MPSERCLSVQEMLTGQRLCQSSSHNDAVLAALNQQRSDGILCDITLIAEEQKFHAHKAVLAACSDYFRAMFSLCMVESEADEVNLHGVTSLGLKQALDFAYTGQLNLQCPIFRKKAFVTDSNSVMCLMPPVFSDEAENEEILKFEEKYAWWTSHFTTYSTYSQYSERIISLL